MNGIDPITGQPSESIANAWLPHEKFRPERIPIQAIKIRVHKVSRGIWAHIKTKSEESTQSRKGWMPWTVYFRPRKEGFFLPLQ